MRGAVVSSSRSLRCSPRKNGDAWKRQCQRDMCAQKNRTRFSRTPGLVGAIRSSFPIQLQIHFCKRGVSPRGRCLYQSVVSCWWILGLVIVLRHSYCETFSNVPIISDSDVSPRMIVLKSMLPRDLTQSLVQ